MCVYSLSFAPLNRNGIDLSHQNLSKWVTVLGNLKTNLKQLDVEKFNIFDTQPIL